jgi:hypothetical protein
MKLKKIVAAAYMIAGVIILALLLLGGLAYFKG